MSIRLLRKELVFWNKRLKLAKENNRTIEIINATEHVTYCTRILRKRNKLRSY